MTKINFRLVFDRGMCEMERYVLAQTRSEAEKIGRQIAQELSASGLDTNLVKVFDQADDGYYYYPLS